MDTELIALFFVIILLSSSIMPFAFAQNDVRVPSPLKQLKSGISAVPSVSANDIKCGAGLVLVIKTSDSSSACVKIQTVQKIVKHGWRTINPVTSQLTATTPIPKNINVTSNSFITQWKTKPTNQPPFPINPTILITKPDKIKIISIEMTPNPLKVGDQPQFTVTYRNISDKPLYHSITGCNNAPPLIWEISPSSNVQEQISSGFGLLRCSGYWQNWKSPEYWQTIVKTVKPNETSVAKGFGILAGTYTITKAGKLDVTLKLDLADGTSSGLQGTIRFNVNATQ